VSCDFSRRPKTITVLRAKAVILNGVKNLVFAGPDASLALSMTIQTLSVRTGKWLT